DMGAFIARKTVKLMLRNGGGQSVTVLGLTFKENVPDLRNTKVIDVIDELKTFGMTIKVHDPMAAPSEAQHEYAIDLTPTADLGTADAVVLAVPHTAYVEGGWQMVTGLLKDGKGVVIDVRGILDRDTTPDGVTLWRL
ncbi:MAG: nucleotide sugar dehydrogenase, partial [Magnetovibrio sp.]|nr:nucleotide sugar dehydrogenase [Magnetovibrio sp.]